ncbi:claudin-10 [Bombina bombina]|uniref:claudin-10 n=1 Tax=Bombina bombina TaxID=8345 RepID=UPI00235A8CFD|nr:claudin-10 [Bombina bombina]
MFGIQILALIFCIAGTGAVIGAVTSNEWKVTSRASSVITATWVFQGLWMNCAGNALGSYHCRPHLTIFRLEGFLQACRALMVTAICLAAFGSVFGLVGMKCTKVGGNDNIKAKVAFTGGLLSILSGICSLSGCSLYAHKTVSEYFDPTFVSQKYELGTALYIGWAGAILCLVGGSIFCCAIVVETNNHSRLARSATDMETRQADSTMHENTGTVIQKNGSRCSELIKYLAVAEGSVFAEGLERGKTMTVFRQKKNGGGLMLRFCKWSLEFGQN